jgi:hypothetical protein
VSLVDMDTELRRRPVVLDTGALIPAPRRSARMARTAAGIAVGVLLAAGAITAGGWSVLTAAGGSAVAGQQPPLWYPTPAPVGHSTTGTPEPAAAPSPAAVVKPAVRQTHPAARPARTAKPSPSADHRRGASSGGRGPGGGRGGATESGDDHGRGGHGSDD